MHPPANKVLLGLLYLSIFCTTIQIEAQNVGIGTTNPAFKLDVRNGSINSDSCYRIGTKIVLTMRDTGNLFIGSDAGRITIGARNTFSGGQAGYSNTSGFFNSFYGHNNGYQNSTGWDNSFFGESAGYFNTTGFNNSFFGRVAGYLNTTGVYNSFFGVAAGFYNSTGYYNSFFGVTAGYSNSTGFNNSFFGESTGYYNTTGAENSFFGKYAGINSTMGNSNTAAGFSALSVNTTGNKNTALGHNANVATTGLTNATAIGANAWANCSNCVILGSVNTVNGANANVFVGIGKNNPTNSLHISNGASGTAPFTNQFTPLVVENADHTYINIISPATSETGILFGKPDNAASGGIIYNHSDNLNGLQFRTAGNITRMELYPDGNAWLEGFLSQSSDRRLKKDIHPIAGSLEKIIQLNGYTYHWQDQASDPGLQYGVIAQEVQVMFPELVQENGNGMLSVNYSGLIPVLIEAIKEQQKQIDELKQLLLNQANATQPAGQ